MSYSQDECRQKLEKLKQWQQQQKKILYDKQMEEKRLLCNKQQLNYDSLINNSINNSNWNVQNDRTTGISENKVNPKRPFLKRGEGLKTRFGVDPNTFNLKNLPKYKYSGKIKTNQTQFGAASSRNSVKKDSSGEPQDLNCVEENKTHAQQEIKSRELKPTGKRLSSESTSINPTKPNVVKEPQLGPDSIVEQYTWASVLDPSHVKPITVAEFKGHTQSDVSQSEHDQLNLFEYLEGRVDASSFSFNSAEIIDFIKQKNLYRNDQNDVASVTTDDVLGDACDLVESNLQSTLEPSPQEVDDLQSIGDDNSNSSCNSSVHVRFSDNVAVKEINSTESESEFEYRDETIQPLKAGVTSTSTPNEKLINKVEVNDKNGEVNEENFDILISQILGLKQQEIQEKTELLDARLRELEHEIALFQQQNQLLTKIKQEHEMEKLEMDAQFQQSKKQLDDEKIKIEIYLNDEKSKLKEEKHKLEKKLSQPNKKDREEIFRLQDQIIELKEEIKTKESKHAVAQSRLRAQMRNLEKNLREKELEIENFKKENKKLEFENGRLRRQATSKMLNEINKNISKLAIANQSPPPPPSSKHDDEGSKGKRLSGGSTHSKSKFKPSKTNPKTRSSSSSSSSAQSSSSSESEDVCDTAETTSTDRYPTNNHSSERTNLESAHSKITTCTPSEIADTIKSLKREISNPDGSKDIWYPDGNIKKISADGLNIKMLYYNKDIKETNINEGIVRYYYAERNTWHTQYLDGLEIFEFPNGQTEHRYKDGKVEIHFEDGSIHIKDPNDPDITDEWRYADGTVAKIKINGDKTIYMPNGQKEIHTADHKRREYPDGTIKIVYPDKSQHTRYSNGRVRLKDKDGKLIMDSGVS